ncbi:hypothetical protein F4778DRAFT_107729 [Xylariomycetidae sp. FL2044]|nr:hypothetical protein F4778DRAFT_107729 [Xylariomycetidae sp. FL2044]
MYPPSSSSMSGLLPRVLASLLLLLPLVLASGINSRHNVHHDQGRHHWVSIWAAMPQLTEPANLPPAPFVSWAPGKPNNQKEKRKKREKKNPPTQMTGGYKIGKLLTKSHNKRTRRVSSSATPPSARPSRPPSPPAPSGSRSPTPSGPRTYPSPRRPSHYPW